MDDETVLLAVLFVGIIGLLLFLGLVATLTNSISSILVDAGLPQDTAGDIGSIFFAGIILFMLMTVIRGVFDS